MKKGLLIILSGPSGVGKGTVREYLFQDKSLNLTYSISMTTRTPRCTEVEGRDYFFVSKETFEDGIKNNKFLEYAKFVDNYYGTPKEYVEKMRMSGKNVLLEIETKGASQLLSKLNKEDEISIFLIPPTLEDLRLRLKNRATETEDSINKRLLRAKDELEKQNLYDYVVVNDTPEAAATRIASIIKENIK